MMNILVYLEHAQIKPFSVKTISILSTCRRMSCSTPPILPSCCCFGSEKNMVALDKLSCIGTVSYTHLDVYKRQTV